MKRSNRNDREYTEVQYLKRENKRLKEQVRSLEKLIKQLERYPVETEEIDEIKVTSKPICPDCHKHSLDIIYVVGRCFYNCSECFYRSRPMKLD